MSVPWHYLQRGIAQGPISEEHLRELITSGVLRPSDLVWHEGMSGWSAIQSTPELIAMASLSNLPPGEGTTTPLTSAKTGKSKSANKTAWIVVACVLGGLLVLAIAGSFALSQVITRPAIEEVKATECSPDFQSFVLGRAPGLAKMADITFDKIDEKREVDITITFPSPVSLLQSEIATRIITKAVLDKLIADGHHPMEERIFVAVSAQAQVKGVTGAPLVMPLGIATYDYNQDSIEFDAKSPKL